MLPQNKKVLFFTSALILLPIPVGLLLQNRFPAVFLEHFIWSIFLPPLSLLAGQWLCVWLSVKLDTTNQEKNRKLVALVLWIMPLISNLLSGILFALMLDVDFSPFSWMTAAFGLLFAAIGNYMPKTKMNSTIGIKVSWTYSSEANWNATHRFAGKVWFIGGIVMLAGILLPEAAAIVVMFLTMIVICALPVGYSYRFYQKEKAEGKNVKAGYSSVDRKIMKASMVFLAALLVFVAAVMFVGDLEYRFEEDRFTIEADWYSDLTLKYSNIQSLEFREGSVPGSRVGGFQSLRLLMGFFRNEEFGNHIRYSYYQPEGCIVLTTERQTLVLSGETREETLELYENLKEKIN